MTTITSEARKQLITSFYEAFSQRNAEFMASCYDPNCTFSDPAFPGLKGVEVSSMWKMLTATKAEVWEFSFSDVAAPEDSNTGSAKWTAKYLFNGKPVTNHITSVFTFSPDSGKILNQVDTFDFWAWSSQSLGFVGKVLGWSSYLQKQVQGKARHRLEAWMKKTNAPQ
jgi:hypothetical protein